MSKPKTVGRRGPTPRRVPAGNTSDNPRLQRAAQLGYVATVSAGADGCFCRACKALREQSSILLDEYDQSVAADVPGDDSQA